MIQEPSFLYVANWKMQLSFDQTQEFITTNKDSFIRLAHTNRSKKIVVCPSYDALFFVAQALRGSDVLLGAQDCSEHSKGSYTGQVSALSLAQLGCRFCIVGHSERRNCDETNERVAEKIARLIEVGIVPILCVGETVEQYERHETIQVIEHQIKEALRGCKCGTHHSNICVAYEPIWAIGTGQVAGRGHIEEVLRHMMATVNELNMPCRVYLLYGGSINTENAQELKSIHGLGGFLIGGASIDFQKFEK